MERGILGICNGFFAYRHAGIIIDFRKRFFDCVTNNYQSTAIAVFLLVIRTMPKGIFVLPLGCYNFLSVDTPIFRTRFSTKLT